MKKVIFILIIMALIISCRKADVCADCLTFYFEKPQPDNDSELDHFPNKFRGLYMNQDSIFIRIQEDRILREQFYKNTVHKLALDSLKGEYDIIDGTLVIKDFKAKYDLKPKGDSIELIQKFIDTLFRFSYNEKAKRIDGQLVLSRRDSLFWEVEFVSITKNKIKFRNMNYREDLKNLDSMTAIKSKMLDSLSYLIRPTRSEFKKILKIKKSGFDQEYIKVAKL
ncbi:hypothetical protein [Flavobacterium piscis]|uniref:Lipoprotein n=1 Tax=Flavobacterium piscis TaxID=1114874 RepID=A0ABU1YBA6_9FLAO|nr:hypothetical protein [Flavobacterium piscis]MDR7210895.1 hypothetical protein [Flavobacterium piscis]